MAPIVTALAAWLVAAAPEQATFLFELNGTPVGTVELTLDGDQYTYRSRHVFTRDGHSGRLERSETQKVSPAGALESGARPESLWLWREPGGGCLPIQGELTHEPGIGCANQMSPDEVRGSAYGKAFVARYAAGRLTELRMGESRFTAVERGHALAAPADLFEGGFPIEGDEGRLVLEPALDVTPAPALSLWDEASARALAERVRASFSKSTPSVTDWRDDGSDVGSCLAHALRFQAWAREAGHDASVVLGLVADGGRAYPHAWVRIRSKKGTADFDPTLGQPVSPHEHLELGVRGESAERVGRAYLDLAEGRRRVARRR